MQQSFSDFGVSTRIVRALAERDITTPFPIQAKVLSDALAGRDVLAKAKSPAGVSKMASADGLPTVHGRPGGPPKGVSMSNFKIMVPKRGDEREESQDAGKGSLKIRKG